MADVRLGTLNKVLLIGRLTRDPDLRALQSGTHVLNFGIAVNRRFQDKDGEWQDDTAFVQIVEWGKAAPHHADLLHKGSSVLVEGRISTRQYEDKGGNKRSSTEIVALSVQCLDKREDGGQKSEDSDDIPF